MRPTNSLAQGVAHYERRPEAPQTVPLARRGPWLPSLETGSGHYEGTPNQYAKALQGWPRGQSRSVGGLFTPTQTQNPSQGSLQVVLTSTRTPPPPPPRRGSVPR